MTGLQHLLVPVNFTPAEEAVCQQAADLASPTGARLTLLHVLEQGSCDAEALLSLPEIEKIRLSNAHRKLEALRDSLGAAAELAVREGRAYEEIIRQAKEGQADLVLMPCGSSGSLLAGVLGSTVERTVRHAPCAVLVQRPQPGCLPPLSEPAPTLLLATDFSQDSLAAFPWAEQLARRPGARLILAHVQEPMGLPGTREYERFSDLIDKLRQEADERLEAFRKEHLPAALNVETTVIEGSPADALCRLAARQSCALLVMAAHGSSGWREALTGSTAERVVRQAACSVLVVRSRQVS